ncbi:hypothetical protein S83_001567, partial [Arachis hypogaea]
SSFTVSSKISKMKEVPHDDVSLDYVSIIIFPDQNSSDKTSGSGFYCLSARFLCWIQRSNEEKYFIHNYLILTVKYHRDLLTESPRIVGFEVKPFRLYTLAIDIWSIGCIFTELDLMTDLLGTPSLDTISQ